MKVCLINPKSPFLIDQKVFPPLGLLYLGAVVKQEGHEVCVVDMADTDDIPEADVYGVTGTTPQAEEMRRLATRLKGKGLLVAGGAHASCCPKEVSSWGYDVVVTGEGERSIKNILYLCREQSPKGHFSADRIRNLDELPFPDRDLIDIKSYRFEIDGKNAATMMSSRGCPFKCTFCCHGIWGTRWAFRSADNIIKEVQELKDKYGYERIMFFDDTFTLKRDRVVKICQGLKGLVEWRCFIRADTVNFELLKVMAKSGCKEIGIGVESGSNVILSNVNKGATVELNTQVLKWVKQAGILAKVFILIGLPGETIETIEETRRWLRENKPDKADICIYTPYPNSPITNNPERYDIFFDRSRLEDFWYKGKKEEYKSLVHTSSLSAEEIAKLRREIEEEFSACKEKK